MMPDPLHPAVVHFPIVMALLAPLAIVAMMVLGRPQGATRRTWSLAVAVVGVLAASALAARFTGEREEERVGRVVGESAIHEHEEATEVFVYAAIATFLLSLGGLLAGRAGKVGRGAALAGSVVAAGLVTNAGFTGGELVYRHGAAEAYVPPGAIPDPDSESPEERDRAVRDGAVDVALYRLASSMVARSERNAQHGAVSGGSQIPESLREEHEAIHGELVAATKVAGRVGAAARELARVLDPHFVREEQIALPPLGLLLPLSRGQQTAAMRSVLPLTDSLRAEMPRMLAEHRAIREATEKMGRVARSAGNARVARLATTLAHHARNEEEVTYPAAVLVGDVVRARMQGRASTP